jgi:hypothetical protein
MVARPVKLIAAALLVAAAGVTASAQTAPNPNNSNPVTILTVPNQAEIPVSAVTPPTTPGSVLIGESTGLNPLTGLPCSGAGSLAVSGVGGLADTATPPPGADSATPQLPTLTSVFGTSSTLGSC